MHNNIVFYGSINVVFQRLNFAIQKDLVAQLIVHLRFIHM
jgi:hypothetical protein